MKKNRKKTKPASAASVLDLNARVQELERELSQRRLEAERRAIRRSRRLNRRRLRREARLVAALEACEADFTTGIATKRSVTVIAMLVPLLAVLRSDG